MLKAVFFDLDGTLAPMNERLFVKLYIDSLYEEVKDYNFGKEKFAKALLNGLLNMMKNDGSESNEDLFWKIFEKDLNCNLREKQAVFDLYYLNGFKAVSAAIGKSPESKKIVEFCKVLGLKTVLSTNPFFPKQGILTRMSFVDLEDKDFDYITSYENSKFCKPNPEYFTSLLKVLDLQPDEVIVFGNNKEEDCICAKKAGIKSYLVDNGCLIIPDSVKSENIICIGISQVKDVIKREFELRK